MSGIRVESLRKSYGSVRALNSIGFEVGEGEFVALLGPSGCGKTTTLRCIAGLERAEAGRIYIHNKLVSDFDTGHFVPPDRRNIGMVFQSYAIWPHMTVFQNVAYALRVRKTPAEETRRAVEAALRLVGMADFIDRPATKLSGGQQQRVALARALVANPGLLLLDEPLSNLDAKLRDHTRGELRRIQQQLGVTALYVTHDQAEAMAICDRIIVMDSGNIVQIGTPSEIYRTPKTPFVAEFVGAMNFLHVVSTRSEREGYLHVQTTDNQTFRIPHPQGAGDKLLVSLRPEACRVSRVDAPGDPDKNHLEGTLVRTIYLGERFEGWVQAAGTEFRVYLPQDHGFPVRSKVRISFKPEECIAFPHAGDAKVSARGIAG